MAEAPPRSTPNNTPKQPNADHPTWQQRLKPSSLRIKQWSLRILGTLLITLLLLGLVVTALISTSTGSRWTLQTATSLLDMPLEWRQFRGTLLFGFDIDDLQLNPSPGMSIRADALSLKWHPVKLFEPALVIEHIKTRALTIQLPPPSYDEKAPEPSAPVPWPTLASPIPVDVRNLHLDDGVIITLATDTEENTTHRLNEFALTAAVTPEGIRIDNITVDHALATLGLTATFGAHAPYPIQLNVTANGPIPESLLMPTPDSKAPAPQDVPLFDVQLSLKGTSNQLSLNTLSTGLIPLEINAEVTTGLTPDVIDIDTEKTYADLAVKWENLHWPLNANTDKAQFASEGHLSATGGIQEYGVTGSFIVAPNGLPTQTFSTSITGNDHSAKVAELSINGTTGILTSEAEIKWKTVERKDKQGETAITGAANIDMRRFNLEPLLAGWNSDLNGQLDLTFSQSQSTQATVRINNLQGHLRDHPLLMGGKIHYENDRIDVDALTAQLGDNQFKLNAYYELPEAQKNNSHQLEAQWTLAALNLSQFTPEIAGKVTSQGNVKFTPEPTTFTAGLPLNLLELLDVNASFEADSLKVPGVTIDSANLRWSQLENNGENLSLAIQNLKAGEQTVPKAQLSIRGSLTDHQLSIGAEHDLANVDIALIGALSTGTTSQRIRWNGHLNRADLNERTTGHWTLPSTVAMAVNGEETNTSKNHFSMQNLCWHNPTWAKHQSEHTNEESNKGSNEGWTTPEWEAEFPDFYAQANENLNQAYQRQPKLCASTEALMDDNHSTITTTGNLSELPVLMAQTLLPDALRLTGQIDADWSITATDGVPSGNANTALTNVVLVTPPEGERAPQRFVFDHVKAESLLAPDNITIHAEGAFLESGRLKADAIVPLSTPTDGSDKPALSANVDAMIPQLDWALPFVSALSELSGALSTQLSVSGTLDAPLLTGKIEANNLHAYVPAAGITLNNTNVTLSHEAQTPAEQRWAFSANSESGKGSVNANGKLDLSDLENWSTDLTISGQQFQVANLPEAKATIAPDLHIAATPKKVNVTGQLGIDSAHLEIKELPPSSVSTSGDEVIISSDTKAEKQDTMAVSAKVDVLFSDDVSFDGFGLTGNLTGKLGITQKPKKPLSGIGTLTIVGGRYEAYGQLLDIDPGRLIFQGPLDNPRVDVRATRPIDGNTLVGIKVGGFANSLSSSLFAEPATSSANALSLLLTGKPLGEETTTDENTMLLNAVASLGISQSEGMVQKLRSSAGLDVLEFNADDGYESSAVTIGKYLTPDLFVSYVQNLMQDAYSLHMEYSLTEQLKLKAESGQEQSVDVLYRFSR
ncbi:translocation/assembly module TamB domain-containing protein [Marinibactrum halimedae]|uniref:DUF490 domain-containing protein n=1 Tax=Marinibactrum halimedae TaxID=1444977 RepID=A0AA37T078_9GAMM|nr:translocation/assembly module TamB domain-containing protein [Marinibactrum halimedae]MCD9460670.1 translocation/assembly module TamB domain-containing protein [Marinibactrum halimedae]GLS24315.1 DUF490 domain-containing protein [Marinibactrum halimedae]